MYRGKRIAAILTAAGSGTRMGSITPKQYLKIGSEMVLEKTMNNFERHPLIDDIYLIVKKEEMDFCYNTFAIDRFTLKLRAIIEGGESRQASVYNGLKVIKKIPNHHGCSNSIIRIPDIVLIHDGARPFITADEITKLIEAVGEFKAATLGVPVKDTIVRAENMWIEESFDRNVLYSVQTPQGFILSDIINAHKKAKKDGFVGTDDAGLIKRMNLDVALVKGTYSNIKITTAEDLKYARAHAESAAEEITSYSDEYRKEYRVGMGFDVHAFISDRDLILGGINIPWEKGLKGHSDADVLTHAIMDALLGACGLGDIGDHFPDNELGYKDISSLALLEKVKLSISRAGYGIENIDGTVIAEKPKIAPYIEEMKFKIANALNVEIQQINIKGTTTEKLGFCGREEGIAAMATASVYKMSSKTAAQEEQLL